MDIESKWVDEGCIMLYANLAGIPGTLSVGIDC